MPAAYAVDEEARAYTRALEALGSQDYARLTVDEARAALERGRAPLPRSARRVSLSHTRDLQAVLFAPARPHPQTGLVLYLHGGGFVMGDARSDAALCERMAADSGCHVLSLDYRLAPEAPFPAAVDDCVFALRWAVEHAHAGGWDASRLVVAGQSAGGNLAAVTAQLWKHARPALRAQLLICPLTDFRPDAHALRARLAHNAVLSADAIAWFERQYLSSPAQRNDPRASPLAAAELSGSAPACVITAAGDPLCDEGEAYARALGAAGVPVSHTRYPSVHGFMEMFSDLRLGELALARTNAWLRRVLSESTP